MKILAIDDGVFPEGVLGKRSGRILFLSAVISDFRIERIFRSRIDIDVVDATERIIEIVVVGNTTIDLILFPSIYFGGFNLIDPIQTYE